MVAGHRMSLVAQTGSIHGKVANDLTGEALVGATVAIENGQTHGHSDETGSFYIRNLSPGAYNLQVTLLVLNHKPVGHGDRRSRYKCRPFPKPQNTQYFRSRG